MENTGSERVTVVVMKAIAALILALNLVSLAAMAVTDHADMST